MVKKVIQKMIINGINIKESTVGVMGITFKENCPDIRNTRIIDLVDEFKHFNCNVDIYDPWLDKGIQKQYQELLKV